MKKTSLNRPGKRATHVQRATHMQRAPHAHHAPRILSCVLAVVLLTAALPSGAFAAGSATPDPATPAQHATQRAADNALALTSLAPGTQVVPATVEAVSGALQTADADKPRVVLTAEDVTHVYDGVNVSITVTGTIEGTADAYEGSIQYGESADSLTLGANPSYQNAGEYTVWYQAVDSTGAYTIDPPASATITISPADFTKAHFESDPIDSHVYDGAAYTPAPTVKCPVVAGDAERELIKDTDYTLSYTDAGGAAVEAPTEVGTYHVVATGKGNYSSAAISAEFKIVPAGTMTVAADAVSVSYDGQPHGLGAVRTDPNDATVKFADEQGEFTLSESPTFTEAGTYTVQFQATRENYEPATGSQTVTITPVDMTVANAGAEAVYDRQPHGIPAPTATGVGGQPVADIQVKYSISPSGPFDLDESPTFTSAGPHTVYFQVSSRNYITVTSAANVDIGQRPAKVTAVSATKVYGNDDPAAFTFTTEGVLEGDEVTSIAFTREPGENAGTYAITPSDAFTGSADYAFTYEPGTLTIEQRPVTVTANNIGKKYGDPDPALTATVSGLARGDAESAISYTLSREAGEDVGEYAITPAGAASQGNYSVTYVPGTLGIGRQTIVVKANDATKVYGTDDPALTATVTGVKEGNPAPTYTIERAEGEDAGSYVITPKGDSLQGGYAIEYQVGTLEITRAPIARPTGAELPYNGWLQTGVESAEDGSYTVTGGSATHAGEYTATAKLDGNHQWAGAGAGAGGAGAGGAESATEDASIPWSITRADATVTADAASKVYGEPDPALTATVGGLLGADAGKAGVISYTLEREQGEDARAYIITPSGDAVQGDYNVRYIRDMFTIGRAAIALPTGVEGLVYNGSEQVGVPAGEGYTVTGGSTTAAGSYAATVTPDANHQWADETADPKVVSWSIARAAATVTADDASKEYGAADPALTATVGGLVPADEGKAGVLSYTLARVSGEDVGTYAIAASGDAVQGNYDVTYAGGTFTITKASGMTVSATPVSATYDKQPHGLVAEANKDGAVVRYGLTPDACTLAVPPTFTNAGNHTVFFQATHDNYQTAVGSSTVSIAPIPMEVAADSVAVTYDGSPHGVTASASDEYGSVDTAIIRYGLTPDACDLDTPPTFTNAGEHEVFFQATDVNHDMATGRAVVSIARAGTMTVAASDVNATYDGSPHGVSPTSNVSGATIRYWNEATGAYDLTAPPSIVNVADSPMLVRFQATHENYEPAEGQATVVVTASNNLPVAVAGTGAVYDGAPHGISVTSPVSGAVVRFYNSATDAYDLEASPSIVNVADSPLTVSYLVSDPAGNYNDAGGEALLTLSPASLAGAKMALVPEQAYTGTAVLPTPAVTLGTAELANGADYTLSYTTAGGAATLAPTQPGSYTVTATGKGNYTGTVGADFAIATPSLTDAATGVKVEGTVLVDAATDGNSVKLTVENLQLADSARFAELEAAYKGDAVDRFLAYKVELGVYTPSGVLVRELSEDLGSLKVTLPVDASLSCEGRAAKVVQLHRVSGGGAAAAGEAGDAAAAAAGAATAAAVAAGEVQEIRHEAVVNGGVATITVDKLSEFVVSVDKADASGSGSKDAAASTTRLASTGDPVPLGAVTGLLAVAAIAVVALRRASITFPR